MQKSRPVVHDRHGVCSPRHLQPFEPVLCHSTARKDSVDIPFAAADQQLHVSGRRRRRRWRRRRRRRRWSMRDNCGQHGLPLFGKPVERFRCRSASRHRPSIRLVCSGLRGLCCLASVPAERLRLYGPLCWQRFGQQLSVVPRCTRVGVDRCAVCV